MTAAQPGPGPDARRVRVLYFAWLRERVGRAEETLDLPDAVTDVAGLTAWLRARDAEHAAAFEHANVVRCAVNQTIADAATPVAAGDEVAFFPPVTGG
jgi:molybdopterin converting factor subunit 1